MNVPNTGWKNKVGTSDRACKCGTWKDHWAKYAGKNWPEVCSVATCSNIATLGAHIANSDVDGERIVPMCDSCNKLGGTITLKGSIRVPRANRSETCDKA